MMLQRPGERVIQGLKILCLGAALLPLLRLAWLAAHAGLGANPIEYLSRATGWWTLAILLATLSITPARRLSGWHWLIRLRRTLGLCTFAYAVIHLGIYLWLDQFFDWAGIVKDVFKRPFITVGFAAFVLMLPLAATSSNAMVRRLGGRRWQLLHRLVYAVGILAVVHFWWLVKKDIREPLAFALLLGVLLGVRLWFLVRTRAAASPSLAPSKVPACMSESPRR